MPAVFPPWETEHIPSCHSSAHSQLLGSQLLSPVQPTWELAGLDLKPFSNHHSPPLYSKTVPKISPMAMQKSSSGSNSHLVFPPEEEKENKTKQQKLLSVGLSGLQSLLPGAARLTPWEEWALSGTGILLVAEPFCSVRALDPRLSHHPH